VADFLVISFWESLNAVQALVGSGDIDQAIYLSEDRAFLSPSTER